MFLISYWLCGQRSYHHDSFPDRQNTKEIFKPGGLQQMNRIRFVCCHFGKFTCAIPKKLLLTWKTSYSVVSPEVFSTIDGLPSNFMRDCLLFTILFRTVTAIAPMLISVFIIWRERSSLSWLFFHWEWPIRACNLPPQQCSTAYGISDLNVFFSQQQRL